jgi:membrane-associated phospholipid phosphatase
LCLAKHVEFSFNTPVYIPESYTPPFHRSELKWVIGLPAVTLGLIAIDKHTSGALSRSGTSASTYISNVGLFGAAGAVGILLLGGEAGADSHALETGVLGAEAMPNSCVVYAALRLITERQRPLQGRGRGNFFQTSGLDNSFPSGHTITTWTAASTIAHEYPKPWGRMACLWSGDSRFHYNFYQPATFPLRCCTGKHPRLFDRTAYFPRALQGWSQPDM